MKEGCSGMGSGGLEASASCIVGLASRKERVSGQMTALRMAVLFHKPECNSIITQLS